MEHTEKLIAMRNNLGLGHKGDIILTTQHRFDNNLPPIAKDIEDEPRAQRLVTCWNEHDELAATVISSQMLNEALMGENAKLQAKAELLDETIEGLDTFVQVLQPSIDSDDEVTTVEAFFYGYFNSLLTKAEGVTK